MYTLVDVSGAANQTGINLGAAGVDGAFVKASGANDGLYIAGGYATLSSKARIAFKNVGHYFFNGPGDARVHADYFIDHIAYVPGDALALDIEDETNAAGVKVTDAYTTAQALAFCQRVFDRLGVVPILYMSAALARGRDWSALVALGAKLWVASWGANTGSPGTPPDIGSSWGEWTMWQYTSNGKVNGWPSRVDLNQSTQKISEIHAMTRTVAGVVAWTRANPKRDGGSWAGWCASYVYRAGGFASSYTSAMVAGNYALAHHGLNPNGLAAPAGAIHYWAGVGGDGHTAIDIGGNTLIMASAAVTNSFGTAVGTISFSDYARKGIPYRGWSMFWGDQTLDLSGTAGGGGTTPIEDDMTPEQDALLKNIAAHLFGGGTSASDPQYYGAAGTVYNMLKAPANVQRAVNAQATALPADGSPVYISQIQDNADTNTLVRQLANRPVAEVDLSDADLDQIAAKTAEKVIAALPKGSGLTKADVVDALKSVTYKAS